MTARKSVSRIWERRKRERSAPVAVMPRAAELEAIERFAAERGVTRVTDAVSEDADPRPGAVPQPMPGWR